MDAVEERARFQRGFINVLLTGTALLALAGAVQLANGWWPQAARTDAAWAVWPQGWNLFAGGENGPEIVAYVPGVGGWTSALHGPESQTTGLWGLERSQRLQSREVAALAGQIPAAEWTSCDAPALDACVVGRPAASTGTVRNPAGHPTLCGSVALASEVLDPWTGHSGPPPSWQIQRFAVLTVVCA